MGVDIKLLISHAAYNTYRKNFKFLKDQVFDLGYIQLRGKELNEVIIKGERMPVVVRKDTLIFDAEAFKVRPNAVVEDLLKKLPGVEVDNDGNITVTGKNVSKVLVDGKEFFPSDLRIATKNLDADLISKIQVYDDRENDPNHIIPESQLEKIIDLKFKKPLKRSVFGKVYGGGGTQGRYQAAGLLNMFRDTLQISLLGAANNLNNTGFEFNDLFSSGGLNRGGNAINGAIGYGGAGRGEQKYTASGVNINTDYGKKLKINLAYLYKHTNTQFNTITNEQQFFGDTTAITNAVVNRQSLLSTHAISATVQWHPNASSTIRYTPAVNISNNGTNSGNTGYSFSNFVNMINQSSSSSNSAGNSFQFSHNISYNRQLKKKQSSFTIENSLQFNPSHSNSFDITNLQSFVATLSSFSLNRESLGLVNTANASLSGNYRYPIFTKLIADATFALGYNHQINFASAYDFDPAAGRYDIFVPLLSSDLSRSIFSQTLTPGLTYNFTPDISLIAHLANNHQNVNNMFGRGTNDLSKDYYFFLPNASFNYRSFSAAYDRSVSLPNIGDMIPYTVVYSPIYSVTGNPDLLPTYRNTFSIRYNKYSQSGIRYNFNASAVYEENSIVRKNTLSTALVQTSTPVNSNGKKFYSMNGSVYKTLSKHRGLSLTMTTSGGFYAGHNFFILNNQDGFQNTYSINATQRFSLNWKDIILFDPEYNLRTTHVSYEKLSYPVSNYVVQSANAHFNIFFSKRLNLEGNYNYQYNPLVPNGFQKYTNLLNLNLAHQFLRKSRAEIKLSCYDLLNQNVSISRSINDNTITDTQSQIIRRYFLLTLQYKFNKSQVK